MKTEVEDIDMLAQAILTEARDEADQIRAEAIEKANAIRQRARDQAEAERKSIVARAQQDADRLHGQVVATAQLKARSVQLERREKLLDSVFAEARKKLETVRKRADYDKISVSLLREALTQLQTSKAQVRGDDSAQKLLKNRLLAEVSKEFNGEFTLGPVLEDGTGIVVDTADGRLRYDNTLENRLSRLQNTLRSSAYRVITGEKP
ncbi:MAG TPA: V-type ATP synthase subunit E family protein [Anaerolineales bacterium]|nr:V-type ATP synthase subunit E family protein [Anaerolineales bacterium]